MYSFQQKIYTFLTATPEANRIKTRWLDIIMITYLLWQTVWFFGMLHVSGKRGKKTYLKLLFQIHTWHLFLCYKKIMVKLNCVMHATVFYKEFIIILAHTFLTIPLPRDIYLKTDPAISQSYWNSFNVFGKKRWHSVFKTFWRHFYSLQILQFSAF